MKQYITTFSKYVNESESTYSKASIELQGDSVSELASYFSDILENVGDLLILEVKVHSQTVEFVLGGSTELINKVIAWGNSQTGGAYDLPDQVQPVELRDEQIAVVDKGKDSTWTEEIDTRIDGPK